VVVTTIHGSGKDVRMAGPQQSNAPTGGMEKRQTYKVICEGGLNSNQNYIQLSDQSPGSATTLLNFEPSLFGGYRRIDGYAPLEPSFPIVDSAGAEGAILGIDLLTAKSQIIVARKTKSVTTYKFYKWNANADWTAYATGLTHTVTGVIKLRSTSFNFDGTDTVCFVDGVNKAVLYNGTTWVFINPASTGADYAHAGGNQAISAPSLVTTFFRCLFIAGDSTSPQIISYSAPNAPYDFTAASGGGQINAGFRVKQIKAFRESLYVFGDRQIKVITIDSTSGNFVIKDISSNIGCLATDSVVEVNGDLMFLAQDGFRTLAGTNKIGDVDIASQSKSIQQDVLNTTTAADFNYSNAVVVRRKSQVRFFFSDPNLDSSLNVGIIGGLRAQGNQNSYTGTYLWEWGLLRGIQTSCCTSGYIGPTEYVLHGGFDGGVYRQEHGNSFNGTNILAIYATPYFDLGEVYVRKTLDRVAVFLRAEGSTVINANLTYDYGSTLAANPAAYPLNITTTGTVYGTGVYGTDTYATTPLPLTIKNIEGSGLSHQFTFSTNDMNAGYSIQAILIEFSINGRK